ncbi:MAG TPA: hypothetical protein DET40_09655 [Lentisphaeria bacterium]|nr:MAG: hypothetical protein A2X45_08440 [Lentisphaerae bacterium GWF2_50_93]HCE43799.1 hypothetical protein [Lentisphaeria bacterium]
MSSLFDFKLTLKAYSVIQPMVSTIGTASKDIPSCRDGAIKDKMSQKNESYLGIPPSLQDECTLYDLPVVETTGYIPLSLRDKEKDKLKRQIEIRT